MASETSAWFLLGLLALYILAYTASTTFAKLTVGPDKAHFDQNSAVLLTEVLKMGIALVSLAGSGQLRELVLNPNPVRFLLKTMSFAIPAVLYVAHNNLMYLALSVLPIPSYQLYNNIKIITTGFIFRMLLGRELLVIQWLSLVLLTLGMMCISLDKRQCSTEKSSAEDSASKDHFHGLMLMIGMALCSACAGVYSELLIKKSGYAVQVNNFWLYFYSIMTASGVYVVQRKEEQSLLDGYNSVVWASIFSSGVMGLAISFIFKYGDNIIKLFGGSLGALCSIILSAFLFNFVPGPVFWCGYAVVVCALILYYGSQDALYLSDSNALKWLLTRHIPNIDTNKPREE